MARELIAAQPPVGSGRALVLDTNIVLDLLVFADPATAPLTPLMEHGALRWIATSGMRSELERVLSYPQIAPRVAFYGLTSQSVLARFDAGVRLVEPAPRAAAVCKDADDQVFIDLAAAHGAIILSKDRAVLQLHKRLLTMGAQIGRTVASFSPPPTLASDSGAV